MEKAQGKLTSDNHASCSGLPALFGVSGYETRNEYLDSRIKARLGENVRSEKGIHAEMGNILENPILQITTEKLGLANLEKNISTPVLHEEYPLGGSIDGIAFADNKVVKPDNELIYTEDDQDILLHGKGILEAKATANHPEEDGKPPLFRGVLQVKGLMAITGYDWACVSTLHRSTMFKMFLLRRDLKFESELKDVILDFERRIKEADYYPPVTHKDTQIMFPSPETAKVVDLNNKEAIGLCQSIVSAKEQIKGLNDVISGAEIRLQEMMGDAEIGNMDGFQTSWKTTTRKTKMVSVPLDEPVTTRNKTVRVKKLEDQG